MVRRGHILPRNARCPCQMAPTLKLAGCLSAICARQNLLNLAPKHTASRASNVKQ